MAEAEFLLLCLLGGFDAWSLACSFGRLAGGNGSLSLGGSRSLRGLRFRRGLRIGVASVRDPG